ncbi:MAG: hypothetical protein OEN56_00130 [Gemmatimonadota bacterium]|nr:hypothetical protein [Gemmatimonadota bacterium]
MRTFFCDHFVFPLPDGHRPAPSIALGRVHFDVHGHRVDNVTADIDAFADHAMARGEAS